MRYVVFLRAINVGKRRIAMADLQRAYSDAGFASVATHIASGNVILDHPHRPSRTMLEEVVEDAFGFRSEAFVRSAREIEDVIARCPWDPEAELVEVSFLERTADRVAAETLEAGVQAPEALVVAGREVYFLREGKGIDTTHKEAATVATLGQVTTRRGMATVIAIRDRFLR